MAEGVWKHIGLHGHSVGTFACEDGGIKWKSALTNETVQGSNRSIPKDAMASAQWTVFGKAGHIRLQTSGNSKLHHELRFDGFPTSDFDACRAVLKDKYGLDLVKYTMSAAGTQFGLSKMAGKKLTFRHCILEDADEEGEVRPRFLLITKSLSILWCSMNPSLLVLVALLVVALVMMLAIGVVIACARCDRNSRSERGKKCSPSILERFPSASCQGITGTKSSYSFPRAMPSKPTTINSSPFGSTSPRTKNKIPAIEPSKHRQNSSSKRS